MNIIKKIILKDAVKILNEIDIIYCCLFRKCQIIRRIYINKLYYFKIYLYNRLNLNNEYII